MNTQQRSRMQGLRRRWCAALAACWLLAPAAPRADTPAAVDRSMRAVLPASLLRMQAIEVPRAAWSAALGWHALVCNAAACELRPVRLQADVQSDRDSVAISFPAKARRKPQRGEYTVAFLAANPHAVRDVPTWFTLRTARRADDAANGSLGVTVRAAGGDLNLVPRWRSQPPSDELSLWLESGSKRQRLGAMPLATLNAGVKVSDVLVFAGDLDGDGHPDLITHAGVDPQSRGLYLWLSSAAGPGDIVGLAASLPGWTDIDEAEGC